MVDAGLVTVHPTRPAEVGVGVGELANGRGWTPDASASAVGGARRGMDTSTMAALGGAVGPSR
jgi:hypothetical protein